ncbi:GNAT family N-acetyltransferase [[Limnothrix rosea] IAM M-220]|uniref:GNAT family N-acetyltransferase n=1 Tax=[Limnothrix rosea] IAM M-220 TaxID=454133 RepID=UPI00095DCC95|nr:GNAT family N-acetyltransferase [[Limnothrix rosea] IAM M-220]OKH17352.1 hypothetical protein NIES208_09685 [[Limnothrix rosea] IAM M-220]
MKILYRLATDADLDDILAVQTLNLKILLGSSLSEEVLTALVINQEKKRDRQRELIFIAICNGKVIGFIALLLNSARITGLFVHPDFVQQGIGSELLTIAIDVLDSKKHRTIFAWSFDSAKAFYRKHGFHSSRSNYLLLGRHLKVRTFWMRKTIRPLTEIEQKRNTIITAIIISLILVSLITSLS